MILMKRSLTIVLMLCMAAIAWCQSAQTADKLFAASQYDKALAQYEALLRGTPGSSLYQYRTARCLQELERYESAVPYFEKSASRYPLAYYYLAVCCQQCYRFDEAVAAVGDYLAAEPTDNQRVSRAMEIRRQSALAAHFLKRIEDIAIIDSQQVDKDAFLRCYRLTEDAGRLNNDGQGVAYTNQRGDQKIVVKGSGLWRCDKLIDKWEQPQQLPLDTMEGMGYPFLMPDGVTLYFAAKGEKSIGGYDIFMTQYNSSQDSYVNPENIGFPFNSPWNDYMLAIDENEGVGYWCTDRRQPQGKVMVYCFVPNAETKLVSAGEDSIIGRASLTMPRMASGRSTQVSRSAESSQTGSAEQLFIEVYDDVVYRHLGDFRSDSARQCYLGIQAAEAELVTLNQRIERLRLQYSMADEDSRATMRQAILNIENDIASHRRNIRCLRTDMQHLEKEAAEQNTEKH